MQDSCRRVIYVVNAFEADAPTQVTAALARGMRTAGWQVAVVAWSRGGPLLAELDEDGIVCEALTGLRALALARWIVYFRPAIVHSVLARPALGMIATRLLLPGRKFRWLAGDHGIHEWAERGPGVGALMNRLMPTALSLADGVVTVSNDAARRLAANGLAADRIAVVPNGVDAQTYYPRSRAQRCAVVARNFPADDPWEVWPLLGSAGNLRNIKGHYVLICALPAVLKVWPKARLIIWGDGPEKENLVRLTEHLGLGHAVVFAGRACNLPAMYPLLDLYVQPSRIESFGLAPAEAMCSGTPAVVSDVGGLPEIANGGKAAWLFSADDAGALSRVIIEAVSDKRKLKKQGAAGRGWILGNYTAPQMVDQMRKIYEQHLPDQPETRP